MTRKKILYGCKYDPSDFSSVRRLARMRVATKGKEFFLLNSRWRVVGIGTSLAEVLDRYELYRYRSVGFFTLHYITAQNLGRCTKTDSRRIYLRIKEGLI